jgi:hypothetical protein
MKNISADVNEYEAGVLRVFQSKDETRAYYNKFPSRWLVVQVAGLVS